LRITQTFNIGSAYLVYIPNFCFMLSLVVELKLEYSEARIFTFGAEANKISRLFAFLEDDEIRTSLSEATTVSTDVKIQSCGPNIF
jgi:hypothetical protein